ncbi:hypothetical protein [Saccharothrix stipae]
MTDLNPPWPSEEEAHTVFLLLDAARLDHLFVSGSRDTGWFYDPDEDENAVALTSREAEVLSVLVGREYLMPVGGQQLPTEGGESVLGFGLGLSWPAHDLFDRLIWENRQAPSADWWW